MESPSPRRRSANRAILIACALAAIGVAAAALYPRPRAPRLEAGDLITVPVFQAPPIDPNGEKTGASSFLVTNHSRVSIQDRTRFLRKITVEEGEMKGRSGWVFEQWISEK